MPAALPTLMALAAVAGCAVMVLRASRSRRPLAIADYIDAVAPARSSVPDDLHAVPFLERVVRPMAGGLTRRLAGLTPRAHLDAVHAKLLKGGLATKVRAEEVVAVEVGAVLALGGVAGLFVAVASPPARLVVPIVVLFPVTGVLAVQSWLASRVQERQDGIRRDLADVLDLLALSVEAGLGFEAAIELVADRLPSPLAVELAMTLREMELGRTRREAFTNLKRRTDVAELNAFVSAVIQADALGVPIAKVLNAQAAEMRLRRRQWAREQAARLPVKVLFPLVAFIFPAMFVVILGPAVGPLRDAFN